MADYYQCTNTEQIPFCLMGPNQQQDTTHLKHRYLQCGGFIWNSIYRRELFFDNDLFFPENIFYEDNAIAAPLILSAKKIIKIDEFLYYYRKSSQSTTALMNDDRFFGRLDTARMCIDNVKRLNLYDEFKDDMDDVFFKQFYKTSILGIFERFAHIPYDKIEYIKRSTAEYLSDNQIKYFCNRGSITERLVLRTVRFSPWLSSILFRLSRAIIRKFKYKNRISEE